ncbi:HAMP domain-containing sensor histidine kinase [Sporosarcina thermotolerans]|uniref:histidine kinase n=1 Tax=Sporosarcina thermotolerans TaxID=633404 RepID=A0AAW9A5U0_9BACL|nr:HAMP domain-containing sensor histidine kinase [Sporosarcina thermotolerans]MDW0116255.1 HAMP domain-containing sensor histidine kinase [Sporosarcina thermotolerans]WHT48228.1 HAMP domain-containing sensor histidine kinase [Sporosarcina thermotolerans]
MLSIKKRLILSNIGMIIIPITGFLLAEIVLGYLLFYVFRGNLQDSGMGLFLSYRFIAMVFIIIITNGLLTYYVSKSIISPIKELSVAAKKISNGNLEYSIKSDQKDELGELTNTFEAMRIKLKEAQSAQLQYEQNRQELIASISHDLKTPLTSIKGYIKGIQDGVANTPEKLERYMDTIYKTANHMDGLIDDLFLFSKLDLQQTPFYIEEVNLYTFFVDFVEELSFELAKEQGSIILLANKEDSYLVKADREKLRRVVTNITQNNLKYMNKKHKEIQVRLSAGIDEVTVEIKDNGSGIEKKDIPYIFNSFYRTDLSRNSSTGGSGLGLSIVKKIINEHGGNVWVDSKLDAGTSIYFNMKR